MPRLHVFSDETGDFHFVRAAHASKYFIICTVSMDSCAVGTDLLDLRRELLFKKAPVKESFHASEDKQVIRDAVFSVIGNSNIEVQAEILEKSKANPKLQNSNAAFYKHGWQFHFKYSAPKMFRGHEEALITVAKIHTHREQAAFNSAVNDVVQQTLPRTAWNTHFCFAASDPCLQVADYCAWAFNKKWETGGRELRPYNLIRRKITHEADMWEHGSIHYF